MDTVLGQSSKRILDSLIVGQDIGLEDLNLNPFRSELITLQHIDDFLGELMVHQLLGRDVDGDRDDVLIGA